MKNLYMSLVAISILLNCGCHYITKKTKANEQTTHERMCLELKNNIIFNTDSNYSFTGTAAATQQSEMIRMYEKMGCDKL